MDEKKLHLEVREITKSRSRRVFKCCFFSRTPLESVVLPYMVEISVKITKAVYTSHYGMKAA